jgi:hypothetical protein
MPCLAVIDVDRAGDALLVIAARRIETMFSRSPIDSTNRWSARASDITACPVDHVLHDRLRRAPRLLSPSRMLRTMRVLFNLFGKGSNG